MAMAKAKGRLDEPEPRWQALLALLAVGAINLALPPWLSVAPAWVLPALLLILLAPSVVAHRAGRFHLNHILGIAISSVITIALISSVALLVVSLPAHKNAGVTLLISGSELWVSNVLAFALWFWRLDGGGPNERDAHPQFGSRSFVFPQMQIEKTERSRHGVTDAWRPGFVDYLFVALTQSSTFGPTDAPILARWAKVFTMVQVAISLIIVVLLISHAVGAM